MALLAAFGALLGRYSGQDDIVVGSPIANRQEALLEELIGFFVNSLVMRMKARPEMRFEELLGEVRRTALEAYQHQDVPFERLVEELSPQRSLNTTPLFQVVFALQNAPRVPERMEGLSIEPLALRESAELRVHYDLEVHAWEQDGESGFDWVYNRDLFDGWRIEQMAAHYGRILEAVVEAPDGRLSRIETLSADERRSLLELNNTGAGDIAEATLIELFETQVASAPEATALTFGQQQLSYRELNERANRLARHLIGLGVGPEKLVGIALERSIEMVVALLGVLKAGGAYLPLDPDYPEARLTYMLADAAPEVTISDSELSGRLPQTANVLNLDDPDVESRLREKSSADLSVMERRHELLPSHPAYVIYTSGSTW